MDESERSLQFDPLGFLLETSLVLRCSLTRNLDEPVIKLFIWGSGSCNAIGILRLGTHHGRIVFRFPLPTAGLQ
jgi:hypothetical protein